jgi:hypothetical protein
MGRAFRYQRRTTHIILSVAERAIAVDAVDGKTASKKARATKTKATK